MNWLMGGKWVLRLGHITASNGSTEHWVIVPLEILLCSAGFCRGWCPNKADAEESIGNIGCSTVLFD